MKQALFERLGLKKINSGVSAGTQWLDLSEGPFFSSINPATEELLGQVKAATVKEYSIVIATAKQAYMNWRHVPSPKRGELIKQIGNELCKYKEDLGTLIALEMGKTKVEGEGEVQEMIDLADFAVGQSRMLYGKMMQSERINHRMYEQWHPLGIIGIITAFNFPVAVWAWNAFIAAICGNTVIWKPSQKVPLCAIAVQNICNRVMLAHNQPGIFSLMLCDTSLTEELVKDKKVALVSFTGSTEVGRKVGTAVATRMGKSLLELGGNNAIIVEKSADLSLALRAIVFGAIGTAGQRCTTTRRLFIHKTIFEKLLAGLIDAYKQVKIGDPLLPSTTMGPVIDQAAVTHYEKAILTIKQQGGEVLWGGRTLPGPGFFVEPTLVKIMYSAPILQQEVFAPILYLISYENLEQAIEWQNDVRQGLSSAIFTRDLQQAELFLSAVGSDCGIANVNIGTSGAEIGGAFGGEKETGGGREAGSDAWQAYMRRQTTTINWGNDLPLAQDIQFNLEV